MTTVFALSRSGRQYLGSFAPGSEALAVKVDKAYLRSLREVFGLLRVLDELPSRNHRNRGRRVMRLPAMMARPVSTMDQTAIW